MSGVSVVQCNRLSPKMDTAKNSENFNNQSRDIVLLNKHSTLSQQITQIKKSDIVTDTAKKKTKCNNKELIPIRTPPAPAVARRNARERNRVKQVNNGFANLRQHIPHSIAAAYESGSGRGGNKKLSKVETLRMAVEYIRSLEDLLSLSDNSSAVNVSNSTSLVYPASSPLSSLEIRSSTNYTASLTSPSSEDDNISSNSTPPPLQYIKMNDPDTYHLVPVHIFENNEHLKSLKVENDLLSNSTFIGPEVEFNKKVQLSTDADTNISLSPEIYTDSSLSPETESNMQAFIPVFNIGNISTPLPIVKTKEASKSPNEEMRILCRNLIMLQADAELNSDKQPLNMNELISW